jgi:hypothetical protein
MSGRGLGFRKNDRRSPQRNGSRGQPPNSTLTVIEKRMLLLSPRANATSSTGRLRDSAAGTCAALLARLLAPRLTRFLAGAAWCPREDDPWR